MAQTDEQSVLDTYGETALDSGTITQLINDAELEVALRWESAIQDVDFSDVSNFTATDAIERVERLLTCHMMKDAEPEMDSASGDGQSVSVSVPNGDIEEWIRNTSHGRTLFRFLTSTLGITVDQSEGSLPRNYG